MAGVRFNGRFDNGGVSFLPEFNLGWQHEYLNRTADIRGFFASETGGTFISNVHVFDRDALRAGVAANFIYGKNTMPLPLNTTRKSTVPPPTTFSASPTAAISKNGKIIPHMKQISLWSRVILLPLVVLMTGCATTTGNRNTVAKESTRKSVESTRWYQKGLQSKDQTEMLSCYTKAIELNPAYADAYFMRGVVYGLQKDYPKAIRDFSKTLELDPGNVDCLCCRGELFIMQHLFDKAIRDFQRALLLNPQNDMAEDSLATIFAMQQDYKKALEHYSKCIAINPNSASGYLNRGFTYCKMGEYGKAWEDCDKAVKLDPSIAKGFMNRGLAGACLGNKAQAIEDSARAMKLDPNDPELYYDRGLIYFHCGDYEKAFADFKEYLKRDIRGFYVSDAKKLSGLCERNMPAAKPTGKKMVK